MSLENEIQAKGLLAARVTPADVEASIKDEYYFTAADGFCGANNGDVYPSDIGQITFCVLVMQNGTKVVGVNEGPVSASNFDEVIGKGIARRKAVDQIWPMLGYELRTKLGGAA